jgi:hypothetical protein
MIKKLGTEPEAQQQSFLHARGGLFIAQEKFSVDPDHPDKKVMALNYRWEGLSNRLPNRLLIDEIVEISPGLYLGKLYYATAGKNLFSDYDAGIENKDYQYRNFGYFALMDDTWLEEKNLLFPELQYGAVKDVKDKFKKFTFTDCEECEKIKSQLADGETILHSLKDISDGIGRGPSFQDAYFDALNRIFLCGRPADDIDGFFHGGVVTFKNAGFLARFERSVLNDIYPAVRLFSPWTGKTFSRAATADIKKYIGDDGMYYKGKTPVILGSNTYRKSPDLSLPATAFIENLGLRGMAVEYPGEKEKREEISVKSFYFIAANEKTVNPENKGKQVLRLNYRWPGLHTLPPDHLCHDELVKIADGLYLGQLLYATKPGIRYAPETDPAAYHYENFGYFMLMDDDWQAIWEFIRFDEASF